MDIAAVNMDQDLLVQALESVKIKSEDTECEIERKKERRKAIEHVIQTKTIYMPLFEKHKKEYKTQC